ncbi:MAG TPA: hypothetical protein VH186_16100 [Chloroflexia bacterium]|nr:hypothetical protein [Chloroflexia bacterium]
MRPTDPQSQRNESELNPNPLRDEEFGRLEDQPEVIASMPTEPFHTNGLGNNGNGINNGSGSNGSSVPDSNAPSSNVPGDYYEADVASPQNALVALGSPEAPSGFRVRVTGDAPPVDPAQDALIMAFEYDRQRSEWWRRRRLGMIGLPAAALVCLVLGVICTLLQIAASGLFLWLTLILLLATVAFGVYCWLTLPRVVSFGRAYRRLVSVPLGQGGLTWCDAAVMSPNFPALRDSFFTLYQESHDLSAHTQPENNAADTERKKQAINDLKALLKTLPSSLEKMPTPFINRDNTGVLDRVDLEPLSWNDVGDLALRSVPLGMQHLNTPLELQRLARDVEAYSHMKAQGAETSLVQVKEEQLNAPLHNQIATRVSENFSQVGSEVDRWRERASRERGFHAGIQSRYREAEDQVQLGYDRTNLMLEEEIQPATQQLLADAGFYKDQVEQFYQAQREIVESRRDMALDKLERERSDLESDLEERLDEQAMLEAEFKSLNDQRLRLETSTDNRFNSLKTQMADLVRRSYALPPIPHFRSDYPEEPLVSNAEECVKQLAALRAETRLATTSVNNALNRFARISFDPLDELGQLEAQISASSKWQATRFLGSLINFRQSGQLLALAAEVSDAVSVYLDTTTEFENLNRRWCGLEASIRTLGLSSSAGRLQEAQEYLLGLAQVTASLHSSLQSAPHNPEMARPSTFQNIYDQAAGLQRELEELGALAGSITHTEERLSDLSEEITHLQEQLRQNMEETEEVRTDASVKLYEISQKQKQILEKLEDLKKERLSRIRAHVDDFSREKTSVSKTLRTGATELASLGDTADRILNKHISRGDYLLEQARRTHYGLENSIAGIVRDFEQSILPERHLSAPGELFVPVWYFQFRERPRWRVHMVGFASCYTAIERTELLPGEPVGPAGLKMRSSFWRFMLSPREATYYQLREEPHLTSLIGAQNLDYPAGKVDLSTDWLEKLTEGGWYSRWLVRLIKIGLRQ